MANQHRPSERETKYTNGLAHDVEADITKRANTMMTGHPQLQGYLLLAGGAALLLFSFGFFPILKWVVAAAGALLFAAGIVRSNIIESISNFIKRFRK